MNLKQATHASFLFYLQVKIALALLLLKTKPKGANIREFIISIQRKFREQTSRYNLQLEKRIFRNQFILLLPELKIYSVERHLYECLNLMKRDDDQNKLPGENAALSAPLGVDSVTPQTLKIRTNLRKIESVSRFVETVVKIKLWSEENRGAVLADLIQILYSLDEVSGQTKNKSDPTLGRDLIVSGSLLRHLIDSIDAERVITGGALDIISRLEEYLEEEREVEVRADEALKTLQFANSTIFDCLTTFPETTKCCKQVVGSFLRRTLTNLPVSKNETVNRVAYTNWYSTFGVWKKEEFTCVEMINTLVCVLKDVEDRSYAQVTHSHSSLLECNLSLLKRLLVSYHKMYISDIALPNDSDIHQWEETLRAIITESISRHSNTVRLAWHCLKLVLSLKLLMSN